MSVGDVKGFRRRLKILEAKGHAPKRSHRSVAQSIAHGKSVAQRAANIKKK